MKKNIGIIAFFLSFLGFGGLLISPPAFSQDAALLPNAVQQFFDNNGNPLTSGTVTFYVPSTTTLKTTWQNSTKSVANTNPVVLNAAGRAIIYGDGVYRQLVKDRNGNTIWDAVTSPDGVGGGTDVGDANLVGTILPWGGLTAPNQYVFAYGQELSRATYPEFLTAVTQRATGVCTSASNTITGLSDTTQINIGSAVEVICFIAGSTVVSKTASSVTLNNPSSVSINATATFFPYGNGNGTTTFNTPDLRGRTIAGRDNMGGSAASRLTTVYYGTDPDALGAAGGSQTQTVNLTMGLFTAGAINASTVSSLVVPTIQPSMTLNYVVKVTPDVSTSVATGVASLGGMTGVIACGSNLVCTGNVIDTLAPTASVTLVGTGWGLTGGPCTTTCTVSVATNNPAFQYGNPVNLQINASVAANALTVSLKGNDGNDPSSSNPVLISFRNVTVSNGQPTWLALTSALSIVVPDTATLGTANSTPFRIWLAAVNEAGSIRLCVINTLNGVNIYPLGRNSLISGTLVSTGADVAHTFYCNDAVTNNAYSILGYFTYESGLATAGTWASIPDVIQLYGPGVPLPGTLIQSSITQTGSYSNQAGTIPQDDSIPQISEGSEYITNTITSISAANIFQIKSKWFGDAGVADNISTPIFQVGTTNALANSSAAGGGGGLINSYSEFWKLTGAISAFTFTLRAAGATGTNIYFNGSSGTTARLYGGVANSFLNVYEYMR